MDTEKFIITFTIRCETFRRKQAKWHVQCHMADFWLKPDENSVWHFSSCFNFPSIRVFSIEPLFVSGGQSIGASASVLPVSNQDWFPSGLTVDLLIGDNRRWDSRMASLTSIHQFDKLKEMMQVRVAWHTAVGVAKSQT